MESSCSAKRDVNRTEDLASKNPILASILGIIFPVAAIIYLDRIENFLKILSYMIIMSFTLIILLIIYIIVNKDKDYKEVIQFIDDCKTMMNFINELCPIAASEENTIAIILARKRKSKANL